MALTKTLKPGDTLLLSGGIKIECATQSRRALSLRIEAPDEVAIIHEKRSEVEKAAQQRVRQARN